MSDIRKHIHLHTPIALILWGGAAGGYLAGTILGLIMGLGKEGFHMMGIILAFGLTLMLALMMGMMEYSNSFDRALRCNYTRRKYLVLSNISYFLIFFIAAFVMLAFHDIEVAIAEGIYGQQTEGFLLEDIPLFIVISFLMMSWICFMGAVYNRLGKAAFVIIWILWMAVCMGSAVIFTRFDGTIVAEFVEKIATVLFGSYLSSCITMMVLGLIIQIIGSLLVLKQAVKD